MTRRLDSRSIRPLLSSTTFAASLATVLAVAGASPPAQRALAAPLTSDPAGPKALAPGPRILSLAALFAGPDGGPIRSGVEWRVFKASPEGPIVVARSTDIAPSFQLEPGDYLVHLAYGFAVATKRVKIADAPVTEKVAIAAGALRLSATVGDQPIPRGRVTYAIYIPTAGDAEGQKIASGVRSGEVVRLAEGVYHVVSAYGETNASVRADLKIESGKWTDAVLRHRAATITLKLVETPGGEALADTNWSVLSPGGDLVQEAVGAFATMTLAEGVYSVVARHGGKAYPRDFKVETRRDVDVEVLAKDAQ